MAEDPEFDGVDAEEQGSPRRRPSAPPKPTLADIARRHKIDAAKLPPRLDSLDLLAIDSYRPRTNGTLTSTAALHALHELSGDKLKNVIMFLNSASISSDRVTVSMGSDMRYHIQFFLNEGATPFVGHFTTFQLLLAQLKGLAPFNITKIEFVNLAFQIQDAGRLEDTIKALEPDLVLLRNCTYKGIKPGLAASQFLNAINRDKKTIVCEYGEYRLRLLLHPEEDTPPKSFESITKNMPRSVPLEAPNEAAEAARAMKLRKKRGTAKRPEIGRRMVTRSQTKALEAKAAAEKANAGRNKLVAGEQAKRYRTRRR